MSDTAHDAGFDDGQMNTTTLAGHGLRATHGAKGSAPARTPPRLPQWDSTLALFSNPYRFIARACGDAGSDVVQGRLLLQPTLCMTGPEAARLFYDSARMQRAGAAPEALRATLFGKGGVQGMDGPAHTLRRQLFLATTRPDAVLQLVAAAERHWNAVLGAHAQREPVSLYRVAHDWLMRAACEWTGITLDRDEMRARRQQVVSLFDGAASGPLRHLLARLNRWRSEHWLSQRILAERGGTPTFATGTPAHAVAWYREADGRLLPSRIAAVELLNLLRPVVAVSVFTVFVAHALHRHAREREALHDGSDASRVTAFVQEVRRHYPFFPAVVARTWGTFEWNGLRFDAGRRVLLDLYGTNHDPRCWDAPDVFDAGRFMAQAPGPFAFLPQVGGDPVAGHRCPGEGATVALMELAVRMLLATRWQVPPQDLRLDMQRLPALPRDGMQVSL
jgi:fatty-acid peroxygenase